MCRRLSFCSCNLLSNNSPGLEKMPAAPNVELFPCWRNANSSMLLRDGDVHVWRIFLSGLTARRCDALRGLLAPEERERAARYYFQNDMARFVVTRALLRIILGRYLAAPPGELRFTFNSFGKPFLDGGADGAGKLQFNVAHSHNVALIAVTSRRKIGIDVEWIQNNIDMPAIFKRYFSTEEIRELRKLSRRNMRRTFYQYWTCKEAVAKAIGVGLSLPLSQIDVSRVLDEPAKFAATRFVSLSQKLRDYSMLTFSPSLHYTAGLVVDGSISDLKRWNAQELLI
jgi:4'-phosphopantetheinyl transferase